MKYKILKYLFYLCLFSLVLGPLGALPLGISYINIYITDIFVGLIFTLGIYYLIKRRKFVRADKIAIFFSGFVSIAVISLLLSQIKLNIFEKLTSGLYIFRLFAYFSVYLALKMLMVKKLVTKQNTVKLLIVVGVLLAVLGWAQYFLYPDLRNLYYLGWDPHFKRIFSTYLDPNYFGLMMVLTIISMFSLWGKYYFKISRKFLSVAQILALCLLFFIFMTLMFTYSRSSYLSLVVSLGFFFVLKRKFKLLAGSVLALITAMVILPRPEGAGVQLERVFSVETRIESWREALRIFADNPILGIGFNTSRIVKIRYNFLLDNPSSNHAGAGFDNSLLFVAATTGLMGFLSYLIFLLGAFRNVDVKAKTSLLAIIVHSVFLNSLFFPWVMLWLWIVLAANVKENN